MKRLLPFVLLAAWTALGSPDRTGIPGLLAQESPYSRFEDLGARLAAASKKEGKPPAARQGSQERG